MTETESLDWLEDHLVEMAIPLAEAAYPEETDREKLKKIARATVGKIGVRIVFGKSIADSVILKKPSPKQP